MCDFRAPPTGVRLFETGEIKPAPYHGVIPWEARKEQTKVGFYYIACTGSHYQYFDGDKWSWGYNGNDCDDKFLFPPEKEGERLFGCGRGMLMQDLKVFVDQPAYGGSYTSMVQNISVSANLCREPILELGRHKHYPIDIPSPHNGRPDGRRKDDDAR